MFAKAYRKKSGKDLPNYFIEEKRDEHIRLLELRGFASDDIREAFQSIDAMALATKGEKPMLHVSVRNADGERLTDEQWLHVADRMEAKLGLSGQKRGIVLHTNEETGDAHMHIGWSRVDEESSTLKRVPFYIVRLKEICREMEREFGLRILDNDRNRSVWIPTENEYQQAKRLGVDLNEIRESIRDCWERSDNGRSFQVALEFEGLTLTRGDRRDLVVIDAEGGIHALGKRLLGVSAAEVRDRCSDIDRETLPTVEQVQHERHTGRRDEHAANLAWEDALAAASIENEKAVRGFDEPYSQALCDTLGPVVLDEVTRNRPTFTRRDIENGLKEDVPDQWERKAMAETIIRRSEVVKLDTADGKNARYTTETVLQGEDHVARAAQALATSASHAVNQRTVAERMLGLSAEKGRALEHICSPSGFVIIDGQAGTGKSTVLSHGREVYEAAGYRVIGLAPTNRVASDLREKGFESASTVDKELVRLAKGRTQWTAKTIVMVDEAAMVDTRRLGLLFSHAAARDSKVVWRGDDRQLPSIERSGMFEVLKQRHGSAVLTEVLRQNAPDERQASQLMARGNFRAALDIYEAKKAIHWHQQSSDAAVALVETYMRDHAQNPNKARFIFAYTNAEVNQINAVVRDARNARGELGISHSFETSQGRKDFAVNDRIQFTATVHSQGIFNGYAGTVRAIKGNEVTVKLDGGNGSDLKFDASRFQSFRHGYAGTIYQGQGRTIDQTYLLHSEYWRKTSSYVALTRHSEKVELFVSRAVANDLRELTRQISRLDERRAASFFTPDRKVTEERPSSPDRLAAWYSNLSKYSTYLQNEKSRVRRQREDSKSNRDSNIPREVRVGMAGDSADRKIDGVRTVFAEIARKHRERENEGSYQVSSSYEAARSRWRIGRDGRQR